MVNRGTNLDTSLSNWKVCWVLSHVSPRSLWTRTWRRASPGFSCAVSSGLSWSAPGSPVWLCVLTDSAWMWPVWQVNVKALWLELGIQRHDIWGISVFALTADAAWRQTHIHVLNIHLCLLLQLHNHFFVKLLELRMVEKQSKHKIPT